jgi:hypothetical protein
MNYDYHPWIEKIEYTFRDFAQFGIGIRMYMRGM